MKPSTDPPALKYEQPFLVLVILISIILILFPAARQIPGAKVAIALVQLVLFSVMIYKDMRNKTLTKTFPELYAQAKAGRKLSSSLEKAAFISVIAAFWMTF